MIYVFGIIGSLIDSIFILTPYHAKYPIRQYKLLVGVLTCLMFGSWFLPQTAITKALLSIICCVIPTFISGHIKNFFYFLIPCVLIGIISLPLYLALNNNVILLCLISWLSEIMMILIIYEDKNYKFAFKCLDISLKIFSLILLVSMLCLSKYYYLLR